MNDAPKPDFNPRMDELSIAIRRQEVARLYHRERLPMAVIAQRLGVHESTISRDVDAIEEAAIAQMEKDGRKMVRRLDRQWNDVIATAWIEYEKSKEPQTESTSQRIAGGESKTGENKTGEKSLVRLVKKGRTGDPRYLAVIIAATEKLAKLHRLGGFVSEPAIQVPIGPGATVVFYLPENGRPVHTHAQAQPPSPESPGAPKTIEAQVTSVSQTPTPSDGSQH